MSTDDAGREGADETVDSTGERGWLDRLRASPVASWALVVVSLVAIFGPSLAGHAQRSSEPRRYADDARAQVWPLDGLSPDSPFHDDTIARYMRAALPTGHLALHHLLRGVDPRTISKVLPYPLLALVVIAVGLAAHRLSGRAGAWIAMALVLGSHVYLARMTGGLPRSFAYPLLAWAMAALVLGRPWLLGAVAVAGAAFYPVAAVFGGSVLAGWLLLLPRSWQGGSRDWSLPRRLLVLAGTASLIVALVIPTVLAMRPFGDFIPTHRSAGFPEAGPGGRLPANDRPRGYPFDLASALDAATAPGGTGWAERSIGAFGAETGWVDAARTLPRIALLPLLVVGFGWLARRDDAARRLLVACAATLVLYHAAWLVQPFLYHPTRYTLYPVPILLAIMVPASLLGVLARRRPDAKPGPLALVLAGTLTLLAFGGPGPRDAGLTVELDDGSGLHAFLRDETSPDAVIAGWPRQLDSVPYFSRRRVLVAWETHWPLHEAYTLEMRQRMRAIIAAQHATDLGPLRRLRDEHGATHFLLDLSGLERPLRYFAPFDEETERAFREMDRALLPAHLERLEGAVVFRSDDLVLIDLRLLG